MFSSSDVPEALRNLRLFFSIGNFLCDSQLIMNMTEYVTYKRIFWPALLSLKKFLCTEWSVTYVWFSPELSSCVKAIPWCDWYMPPDHRFLDSSSNLGPLISLWEINKFEYCWYNSVRKFRKGFKASVSAIFEFVKFPTRYEWSNIRGTVQ